MGTTGLPDPSEIDRPVFAGAVVALVLKAAKVMLLRPGIMYR